MAAVGIAGLGLGKSVLLALFGLVGGVGITALGPGGVLITIGLFALSGLSPAGIAGTAIAPNLTSGLLGSAVFVRSGQLRRPATRRLAAVLVVCAVVATPLGVLANSHISGPLFGTLLGVCVVIVGALLYLRVRSTPAATDEAPPRLPPVIALGAIAAAVSGLFGLGGPLLSVPLLVAVGTPMLTALAAAQVQSIVIAGAGTVGYALRGDVSWALAALVGLPALAGVLAGGRVAHALPADRLSRALAATLVLVGAYLIVRSA